MADEGGGCRADDVTGDELLDELHALLTPDTERRTARGADVSEGCQGWRASGWSEVRDWADRSWPMWDTSKTEADYHCDAGKEVREGTARGGEVEGCRVWECG
jgi:hypothetical protein